MPHVKLLETSAFAAGNMLESSSVLSAAEVHARCSACVLLRVRGRKRGCPNSTEVLTRNGARRFDR